MAGDEDRPSVEIHQVPAGAGEMRQVLVADPSIQGEFTLIYQLDGRTLSESIVLPTMPPDVMKALLRTLIVTLGSIAANGEQILPDTMLQDIGAMAEDIDDA